MVQQSGDVYYYGDGGIGLVAALDAVLAALMVAFYVGFLRRRVPTRVLDGPDAGTCAAARRRGRG